MKIALYQTRDSTLDLQSIAGNISHLAPTLEVSARKAIFEIPGFFVISPLSYRKLPKEVKSAKKNHDLVVIFTNKQYDNNYFFEGPGRELIVSLSGWEFLTNIPKNNGAVFFILAIVIRILRIGSSHFENVGCINDFWGDKTGVDVGMRSAFICPQCRGPTRLSDPILKEIDRILNDLSKTSREEVDICDFWKNVPTEPAAFDVFICYNSEDKIEIREICRMLAKHHVSYWLEEEQLRPGHSWQDALEEQISTIKTAAVFVGRNGLGPWQRQETKCFLQEFAERKCPVIPIVLKSCRDVPKLPIFLKQMQWVDFRRNEPDPFLQLLWGITGRKPPGLASRIFVG